MTTPVEQQAYLKALSTGHPGIVTSPNQAGVVDGMAKTKAVLTVSRIRARDATCDCPHCGEESNGWLADPRGREATCDACGSPFVIADDATVSIS